MRVGLERLAAKWAMERILAEEVLVPRQQFEVMAEAAKADYLDRFSPADRMCHRMLDAVAGRDSLYQRIVDLTQSATRAVKLAYGIWRPLMLGLDAHRPLMEAIEVGNPDRVAQLNYGPVAEGGARIHDATLRCEDTEVQPFPRPRSAAISRATSSGSPSGGQSISTWTRNPIPPPLRSASPRTRQVGPSGWSVRRSWRRVARVGPVVGVRPRWRRTPGCRRRWTHWWILLPSERIDPEVRGGVDDGPLRRAAAPDGPGLDRSRGSTLGDRDRGAGAGRCRARSGVPRRGPCRPRRHAPAGHRDRGLPGGRPARPCRPGGGVWQHRDALGDAVGMGRAHPRKPQAHRWRGARRS